MDPNKRFCQILLRETLRDLTGRELAHFRKHCSALRMSGFRGFYLVEWSEMDADNGRTFTHEVQADNANEAKAKAINHWLEYHAERCRAKGYPPRKDG